jgi:hypothetical protein
MLQRILNSASAWLQALRNKITSALLPAYEFYGEGPEVSLDRSAKVLTPDVVKDELAVDERIDAIKRLVQTKAMKQMLVGTSPNGINQKKSKAASPRNQEEVSPLTSPGQIALESICGEKTVATEERRRPCADAPAIAQPGLTFHNLSVGHAHC